MDWSSGLAAFLDANKLWLLGGPIFSLLFAGVDTGFANAVPSRAAGSFSDKKDYLGAVFSDSFVRYALWFTFGAPLINLGLIVSPLLDVHDGVSAFVLTAFPVMFGLLALGWYIPPRLPNIGRDIKTPRAARRYP